jgi:hypothetical protein
LRVAGLTDNRIWQFWSATNFKGHEINEAIKHAVIFYIQEVEVESKQKNREEELDTIWI